MEHYHSRDCDVKEAQPRKKSIWQIRKNMLEAARKVVLGTPSAALGRKLIDSWRDIDFASVMFLILVCYFNILINVWLFRNLNRSLKLPFVLRVSFAMFVVIMVSAFISVWAGF